MHLSSTKPASETEQNGRAELAAAEELMSLVTGKDVECVSTGKDQYGRILLGPSLEAGRNRHQPNHGRTRLARAVAIVSIPIMTSQQSAKAGRSVCWLRGCLQLPEQY